MTKKESNEPNLENVASCSCLNFIFFSIAPWNALQKGALIKSVEKNSSAFDNGLRQGMIIKSLNGNAINNIDDYTKIIGNIFNNTQNETKLTILTDKTEIIYLAKKAPEITLGDIPKSNLKTGLDLSGGARALVKPVNITLSTSGISDLISVTNERFNVFGISDITIRPVKDLQGVSYMLIEIAGATPADLKELVGKQGKFEAKIGNETIFVGGEKDITKVCRNDAQCARIESCSQTSEGYACRFSFSISLSNVAAQRQADVTRDIKVNTTEAGRYLEKKLDLYLDDSPVDSLLISEDLKGRVTAEISVSGSGTGKTQQDALISAKANMQKLQTILITGSLPFKLEIVKLDTISSFLGQQFTKNLIFLAILVFGIISIILFLKYRKIKITLAVILTMFSEAFITLGIAALIRWNLDAPSIAGLIAGMGTGVNDQIVIIDEAVSKENSSLVERIKRALFIIVGAFLTIVAAMLPLFWAGAGMLRGFALTTIIGVSVGILITRPAFADMVKRIQE